MFTKIFSLVLFCSIFGAVAVPSLLAQNAETKQEKKIAKVKEKVIKLRSDASGMIRVKLYNGTTYAGRLTQADNTDFVLIDGSGSPHTIRYSDVDSVGHGSFFSRHGLAIGITIGVVATLAIIVLSLQGKHL